MFDNLTERLNGIFTKLKGKGLLKEEDVNNALREIRIALLEADVALPVVKTFIQAIQEKAVGQEIIKSISPGQMIVKIVHDHLISMLGETGTPLNLNARPPVSLMLVGLQGSGKTTTTIKLANYLKPKKSLLVSLDIYRPAAQKQLEILGKENDIESLPIIEGEPPLTIAKRGKEEAIKKGIDVVIFDTAGRLHIDEALMKEIDEVHGFINPLETLLVVDAMTGQDAINVANGFKKRIPLTGVILTRMDGDSKGGVALSMRSITECPIKFLGIGEQAKDLQAFEPHRVATRILDKGDIVELVERASSIMEQEDAEKLAKKLEKGHFDLNDMELHLGKMLKMGGMSTLLGFLPGAKKVKEQLESAGIDDKMIKRQIGIVRSMTPQERKYPTILNASRRRRIAAGCGQTVADVNKLVNQFEKMQSMMKKIGKLDRKKFSPSGLKNLLRGF